MAFGFIRLGRTRPAAFESSGTARLGDDPNERSETERSGDPIENGIGIHRNLQS
jgi:hypothetical protein